MEVAAKKVNREVKHKKRSLWLDAWMRMRRNRSSVIAMILLGFILLIALIAPFIVDYDTDIVEPDIKNRLLFPAEGHVLGTDEIGRDIFSRILYGSRFSLTAGILTVLVSSVIGITIGSLAGYYGGLVDTLLMRLMDILLAIPGMLLMITIVTALEPNFMNLIIAMSISSIPSASRMIRVQVMKVKHQEFIEAVRVLGASDARIIISHILPNAISPLISTYAMAVAGGIMGISAMSFLGLGVQPPNPEWGAMLSSGKAFIRDVWHVTAFPGIAIVIVVVLLTLLGDGLRDALDPKMKR